MGTKSVLMWLVPLSWVAKAVAQLQAPAGDVFKALSAELKGKRNLKHLAWSTLSAGSLLTALESLLLMHPHSFIVTAAPK